VKKQSADTSKRLSFESTVFAPLPEEIATGPVLPVTDGHSKLLPFAAITTWAVMLHPRDAKARDELLITQKAGAIATLQKEGRIGAEVAGKLLEQYLAPHGGLIALTHASGDRAMASMEANRYPGFVTGQVFLQMVRMYASELPASLNKAVHVVVKSLQPIPEALGRKDIATSDRSIISMWETYKPAAHLWAAHWVWHQTNNQEPDPALPAWRDDLLLLLSSAELFYRLGARIIPHSRQEPLLDPSEAWRVPPDFEVHETHLAVPVMDATLLQDYRAPKRF
jgi:hypothetical protein